MKNIAICAGLWLAEGDNKSIREITFTNNCWELIKLFHKTLTSLFSEFKPKIRIYVYNNTNQKIKIPLNGVQVNYYLDKRANKPYYIWRFANTEAMKKWKNTVTEIKANEELYDYLLKGFFAGEGNIKFHVNSSSRVIRIAQGKRNLFFENLFTKLGLTFKFYPRERSYSFSGKKNLDIFAKKSLCNLHPEKSKLFNNVYLNYKEEHYPKFYLKNNILKKLSDPKTTKELAKIFGRSQARVSEVLIQLKKEKLVNYYRINSLTYWTNNKNLIIISKRKQEYIKKLQIKEMRTIDMARALNITSRSVNNRLNELVKLNLVGRKENKSWYLNKISNKEVLIK